jgi:hypothetical protein
MRFNLRVGDLSPTRSAFPGNTPCLHSYNPLKKPLLSIAAENQLQKLLPGEKEMQTVIKVVSLPHPDYGQTFTALMDSDHQKGTGFIS